MSTVQKEHKTNIETACLYMILLFSLLVAISNILHFQVNTSSIWLRVGISAQIIIVILDLSYIVFHYARKKTIYLSSIKLYIYVFYIILVCSFFYSPSPFLVIAEFAWPLTYIVYYMYCSENDLPQGYRKLLVLCHMMCCLVLVRTVLTRSSQFTNTGPVYHAISYLPMVLLICNKREKFFLSIFAVLLVLLTAKRAGFIALVIGFFGYFLLKSNQVRSLQKKILSLVGIILIAIIASYFVILLNENVLTRLNNILVDQGSGRLIIWETVLNSFNRSPLVNKIFGHGMYSVPHLIAPFGKTIFAHNSYLEILHDLGIVGLSFILILVFNLVKFLLRLIKEKNELAPTAFFAMTVVMLFSLVSYFFEESNYIMLIISYWGVAQGIYKRKYKNTLVITKVH